MKYCLKCGGIYSEDSAYDYFNDNECETCGYKLTEDDMTSVKYNLMSEVEKDEYEQKLLSIIQNSSVFSERLYNMYNKYGTADFYFYFRFDKYEQMTGKRAGRKLTLEEEKAMKKRLDEQFGPNSPAYQKAVLEQCIQADRDRKAANSNTPRCPTCNSTSIEKISLGKKALGGAMFGIFSSNVRNTFHCKNCGYKW